MKILCSVPESLPRETLLRLETSFRALYAEHFGKDHKVLALWNRLPPGQSFVEGRPSDVHMSVFEVADGLVQPRREAFMHAAKQVWVEVAGIPATKPLITVLDTSKFDEYLAANRNRLRAPSRLPFLLGTLWHAFLTKRRDGYAAVRTNL